MVKNIYIALAAMGSLGLAACDDFLDYKPTAVIDEDKAFADPDGMTAAAYAMLGNCWYNYPFNLWFYGDMASDDCLKGGGDLTDTGYNPFELWKPLTDRPGELDELWYRLYVAISRCNRALSSISQHGEARLGADDAAQRHAEVLFLRAHFYYKLATVFNRVPWIDQEVFEHSTQEQTKNNLSHRELLEKIIADFTVAYNTLPETNGGRANKIAAAAYIAKCYLDMAWGNGYEEATGVAHIDRSLMEKVLEYTQVVKNSGAYGYLEDYGDVFLPEYDNSRESIFAVQASDYADDNTTFGRANWSNLLNGCWGIWSCGWDFHKPSQNFVDAFRTVDGLPDIEGRLSGHAYPICGQPNDQKWDPRLFHTVGMPTFPYKYEAEYTLTTANSRDANDYGYYTNLKDVPQRSKGETYNDCWQAFAMNDYVFRYADVMLMRAEALIECDRLAEAREILNDIRSRAAASIDKHIGYAADQCQIALYPEEYFANKETARKCLRTERRLEMGQEHTRFFDLRRWGIASQTLNAYFQEEQKSEYEGKPYGAYLKDAFFTAGKNEFWPVPYNQLNYIPGLYEQNKGY